jgi:hypothetical protein
MMKRALVLVLCAAMAQSGCAAAARSATAAPPVVRPAQTNTAAIASFVQKLPAGTRVKVERFSGGPVKGTLLQATDAAIVLQRNTRVPESPVEIPLADVSRVTIDTPSNVGRSLAIAGAVGAGAALGIILILAALYND